MARNDHFRDAASWGEAAQLLSFSPKPPGDTGGRKLKGLAVHVLDHKRREVPVGERTLEAYYDGFTVSQSRSSIEDARRRALELRHGPDPIDILIGKREGRLYALGPEVPADDIDGRQPSVIVWSEGDIFHFIASAEMPAEELVPIARSI